MARTILTLTILSLLSLSQCQRGRVPRNPLASALQSILSPGNAEALKMFKLAAGARGQPCPPEIPTLARPNPMIQTLPIQRVIDNRQIQPRVVENVIPYQPVIQEKVYVTSPPAPCPYPNPPPLINPFLPAASPVSAIAPPTSSLLPPADIRGSRCNFLRKIPIPPPSL